MIDFPQELVESYTPIKLLGEGGMGTVVLAQEASLERLVAVKLARMAGEGAQAARDRFLREAQALSMLRHPNVLGVFNFGITERGDAFLVMEYLEGRTLDRLAPLDDPLTPLLAVAEALESIHRRRLVHRDVKSSNIMVTADGRTVLVDFGLVHDPSRTHITRTGRVVGTLSHLSPEAIAGAPPTPAADWYAWGVTLFEAAEGRAPYSTEEAVAQLAGESLPPPEFHWLQPAGPMARLIRQAMDPDPNRRPRSLREIRAILGETAAPAGASTQRRLRASPPEEPPRPRARTRGLGAATVLVLLSLLTGYLTSSPRPRSPTAVVHAPELQETARSQVEELERLYQQLAPEEGVQDRLLEVTFHPLEHHRRRRGELVASRRFEDQVFHSRWESYLRALEDWWLTARRWGEGRDDPLREMAARRVLARHHFGLALSILTDFQVLDDAGRLETIWHLDPQEVRRGPSRTELSTFLDFFRGTCKEFLAHPRLWSPRRPEPLLTALRALFAGHLENNSCPGPGPLEDLVRRFASEPPTWETYWTGKAVLVLLATNPSDQVLPWPLRRSALDAVEARLEQDEDWPEDSMRARLLGKCVAEEIRLMRLHRQAGGRLTSPQDLGRLLDQLVSQRTLAPQLVAAAAAAALRVAHCQGHVYYSNEPTPAEYLPLLERLRLLAGPDPPTGG